MNLLNFFLPWNGYKNTQIPFGADIISGAKRKEEEEAIKFFHDMHNHGLLPNNKNLQKAEEMGKRLGLQCPIGEKGETTVAKIIENFREATTLHEEHNREEEAWQFFHDIHNSKLPFDEITPQKAEEMGKRLGEAGLKTHIGSVEGPTIAEILERIRKKPTTGLQDPSRSSEPSPDDNMSVLETFQKTYEKPDPSKYSALFNLLEDKDLSDQAKREKIYAQFKQDPGALWVCVSHPILICKNSELRATPLYQLQQYIFEDAGAWETIFKLALGHSETIGLRYVEAILLPIMQEALSLNFESPHLKSLVDKEKERLAGWRPEGALTEEQLQLQTHQHLIAEIVLTSIACITRTSITSSNYQSKEAKQCPKIIKELLKTPDLISNHALAECQVPYTPIISLDMMDMDDQLSNTANDDSFNSAEMKQQNANDKEAWRTKSLKALTIAIREREELMDKQAALIKKHPWLLSHKIEIPSLKPKEILGILKDIIEVSADVAMPYPYNTLWAQENLDIRIQNVCVNLLLRFSDKINTLTDCLSHSELSFVHSAASRGDEAVAIIKAISLEPKLHFLFQKFCDHRGKDGSPLEIALKAGGLPVIRDIFKQHTENLEVWKSLFKSEYHENIHSKEDALKLIQQKDAYKLLHPVYRLLDHNYHKAECKIKEQMNAIYSCNQRWVRLIATLKEPEDIVLQQVLTDHLEYLEYLLKLAHTGRSEERFFILRLKNFRNAIIDVMSNPNQLKRIQKSPEIYPTICWWMTFLPKASGHTQTPTGNKPGKNPSSLGFSSAQSPASQFKNNTPNSLVGALSKVRNPETQPIMRFEEKVKQAIASLMEDMLKNDRLPASVSTDLDTPVKPSP